MNRAESGHVPASSATGGLAPPDVLRSSDSHKLWAECWQWAQRYVAAYPGQPFITRFELLASDGSVQNKGTMGIASDDSALTEGLKNRYVQKQKTHSVVIPGNSGDSSDTHETKISRLVHKVQGTAQQKEQLKKLEAGNQQLQNKLDDAKAQYERLLSRNKELQGNIKNKDDAINKKETEYQQLHKAHEHIRKTMADYMYGQSNIQEQIAERDSRLVRQRKNRLKKEESSIELDSIAELKEQLKHSQDLLKEKNRLIRRLTASGGAVLAESDLSSASVADQPKTFQMISADIQALPVEMDLDHSSDTKSKEIADEIPVKNSFRNKRESSARLDKLAKQLLEKKQTLKISKLQKELQTLESEIAESRQINAAIKPLLDRANDYFRDHGAKTKMPYTATLISPDSRETGYDRVLVTIKPAPPAKPLRFGGKEAQQSYRMTFPTYPVKSVELISGSQQRSVALLAGEEGKSARFQYQEGIHMGHRYWYQPAKTSKFQRAIDEGRALGSRSRRSLVFKTEK